MTKCPDCGNTEKIYKHGKSGGVQRFKCKKCGKTFIDKNYVIKSKKDKEFAIALLNLLKMDPKSFDTDNYTNLDLTSLLQSEKIDENSFKDVTIQIKTAPFNTKKNINCNNPRIIISLVDNEIRLTLLPQYDLLGGPTIVRNVGIQGKSGRYRKAFTLAHKQDEKYTNENDKTIIIKN